MTPARIAIAGAAGRTGRAIVRAAAESADFEIVAALTAPDDPALGRDAGVVAGVEEIGVVLRETCDSDCNVLIDFTLPAGCRAWARWCASNEAALVSGVTGLSDSDHAVLRAAAERVPVVWSPNMSVGVNLLMRLVEESAKRLGLDWDVEISETHHKHKLDAPSGTARVLYEIVCAARGQDPLDAAVYGRYGCCGPRPPGEIGVHSIRAGDDVGEHTVQFGGAGETLTLRHRAQSRDIFASGALHAARWVVEQPPGLYDMRDVLTAL